MKVLRGAALTGAALGAYALVEPYLYRLTTKTVPLAPGRPALDVLHLSDTHMRAGSRRLQAWLDQLPKHLERAPDLVLVTGDLIEDDGGIDPILSCLARLDANLGRFYVLGSHDYYQARFVSWRKYLDPSMEKPPARPAATARLIRGLDEDGWISLINRTHLVESPFGRIRVAGVDDPYIKRHNTDHIERTDDDVLAIGLVHAPDVVSEWILAGFDLVLAGHTHAGQVRVPGVGALVTNCSLPNALAGGLHRIGNGWLHVSPGLGTSKFAPIRFACRPETTLLRLRPGGLPRDERRR